MTRALTGLLFFSVLAGTGTACTRNHGTMDATGDRGMAPATRVADPMAFVILHGADLARILDKHADDCDRTLSELLEFVADHREAYLDSIRGKPAGWLPEAPDDSAAVRFFMDYADRCPAEVTRLNEAIHALTR